MASIFRDNGTLANWTVAGANTTFGGNNGMFGTLGASTSMHINFSGAAYVFEGTKLTLPSIATVFQFYLRPASTATINTGNSIFTVWVDGTYTAATCPIRIDFTPVTSTTFKFSLVDPTSSYISTSGASIFTLGTEIGLNLYQTSAGWTLSVAGKDSSGTVHNFSQNEVTYTKTQATVGYKNITAGTVNQNAATSYVGVMDFGEFWIGNLNAAPTGASATAYEMYQGYVQSHLAVSGQPYRGPADGSNGSYTSGFIDTVSETAAYLLVLSVQNNDQATTILVDNWILQNLLRSNSTVANTQSNAAPTTGLNLMCFKYNSGDASGKGIGTISDANDATDADPERMQALFWAHARWGSSALTVGVAGELITPNYKQRALNVASDLRTYRFFNSTGTGYNYLGNDSFQSGATIQMGGDYSNPSAYQLAGSYDTANTTFWNNAVLGAYDSWTKASNVIFSGGVAPSGAQASTSTLNPDWFALTVATAAVSTSPSTYGDSDYGYNAFRIYQRLYDMWKFYADTNALTVLQLPKAFFTNEWSVNAKIRATFKHDGTLTGNYEANLFTYAAFFTIYANDTSNTTATAIQTNKLATRFVQQPYGSVFNETPTSGTGVNYGYFGQSWLLRNYMSYNGLWTNYGQAAPTSNHNLLLLLGVG